MFCNYYYNHDNEFLSELSNILIVVTASQIINTASYGNVSIIGPT